MKSLKFVWSSLILLFFFVIGLGLNEKSFFRIESILITPDVKESEKLVWKEVNSSIEHELRGYKGHSLWDISFGQIKQQLLKYPYLQKVQIQKSWPNKLEVSYSLPPLRAIYPLAKNRFQILTADGNWLGPLAWSRLPGLPWVRGDWIVQKPELKSEALLLLEQLPKKGPLSVEQISEIRFSELDGFLITLIKSGQQIRFGMDNFEIKSLRALQVLDYLQVRGLESRVIDLNFSKKVLVRLRNQP